MFRSVFVGGLAVAGSLLVAQASEWTGAERRGQGQSTISGYTVSAVSYHLSDDALVRAVSFELDGPAKVVTARLNGEPARCFAGGAWRWTCELEPPGLPVAQLESLAVLASER